MTKPKDMTKEEVLYKLKKLLKHSKSDDFEFYTLNIQPLLIILGKLTLEENL